MVSRRVGGHGRGPAIGGDVHQTWNSDRSLEVPDSCRVQGRRLPYLSTAIVETLLCQLSKASTLHIDSHELVDFFEDAFLRCLSADDKAGGVTRSGIVPCNASGIDPLQHYRSQVHDVYFVLCRLAADPRK